MCIQGPSNHRTKCLWIIVVFDFHNNRWYIIIFGCISKNSYWKRLWVRITMHRVFEDFFFFIIFFGYDFIFGEHISFLETENIDFIRIFFWFDARMENSSLNIEHKQQTRATLKLKCEPKLWISYQKCKAQCRTMFQNEMIVCLPQ